MPDRGPDRRCPQNVEEEPTPNPDIGGLNLQQGGALFRWGNQRACGMYERSTHESPTAIG